MIKIKDELQKILNDEDILINEPMKNHTSFKIGGPADYFVTIKDIDSLIKIRRVC